MKKNNPRILYDKESRVLSIEIKKAKSADSDIQGNVVIDYDRGGKVARINLYNFSFSSFRNHLKDFRHSARDLSSPLRIK